MDYLVENRVALCPEKENKSLYNWSIREFDGNGKQIGRDQIPWDWSLIFETIELTPTFTINIKTADEAGEKSDDAELSEYIYAKLRPSTDTSQPNRYSMLGTERLITEFGLFIRKATDDKSKCHLWGSVSYTAEDHDFRDVTEPDAVQIDVYLAGAKFDQLMNFVRFPRPTGAEIWLKGVSGFYSGWSPSISTDSIKILANTGDQRLENPFQLDLRPPVLGRVREFDLRMLQQYPIGAKRG